MAPSLDALAGRVRRHPFMHRCARAAVRLIPDIAWTRRFPEIGPIRFRLRQQRWYLWEPFAKSDRFMLGVFDRLVRRGDVVYDIGANIGIYARILAQWFEASRVIAFEPMRQNVELLRANVELGDLGDRVTIVPAAASDTDGEEDLQIDDVRSSTAVLDRVSGGAPSAGRRHFDLPPRTERVTVARLDTVVADRGLPAPDVIKIDTEGAEALVLDGARRTIEASGPRITVATHGADKAAACLEILTALGYACAGYVIDDAGQRVYRLLAAEDAPRLENNNFIASPEIADVREPIELRDAASIAGRDGSSAS